LLVADLAVAYGGVYYLLVQDIQFPDHSPPGAVQHVMFVMKEGIIYKSR